MKTKKRSYSIFIIFLFFFSSCSSPTLDGHYHLVWNKNNKQFQTWNIRNNRMKINEAVCLDENDCFSSQIKFKGNKMFILPWVDIDIEYFYTIEENGTIMMYDKNDTVWLVPKKECLTSKDYFKIKTAKYSQTFEITSDSTYIDGIVEFPIECENELIIGGTDDSPFFLFNNRLLKKTENGDFGIAKTKNRPVWIHVDKNMSLKTVLPIISELYSKGYSIFYSMAQILENNEQIKLLSRSFKNIKKAKNTIEINYCEHCSKYPANDIESLIRIKMINIDQFIVNGEVLDLFQTRNKISKHHGQNRKNRLNTEVQIEIDGNTKFSDYLVLINELHFAQKGLYSINNYYGKDDIDEKRIRQKQNEGKEEEIIDEFPMRIKEIIK